MGKRIDLKDLQQYIDDKGFIVQNHCWKCQKISYRNEKDAKTVSADMFRLGKGHTYAYACPKGNGWHLTSKNQEVQIAQGRKNNVNQQDKVNLKGGDNE